MYPVSAQVGKYQCKRGINISFLNKEPSTVQVTYIINAKINTIKGGKQYKHTIHILFTIGLGRGIFFKLNLIAELYYSI